MFFVYYCTLLVAYSKYSTAFPLISHYSQSIALLSTSANLALTVSLRLHCLYCIVELCRRYCFQEATTSLILAFLFSLPIVYFTVCSSPYVRKLLYMCSDFFKTILHCTLLASLIFLLRWSYTNAHIDFNFSLCTPSIGIFVSITFISITQTVYLCWSIFCQMICLNRTRNVSLLNTSEWRTQSFPVIEVDQSKELPRYW